MEDHAVVAEAVCWACRKCSSHALLFAEEDAEEVAPRDRCHEEKKSSRFEKTAIDAIMPGMIPVKQPIQKRHRLGGSSFERLFGPIAIRPSIQTLEFWGLKRIPRKGPDKNRTRHK